MLFKKVFCCVAISTTLCFFGIFTHANAKPMTSAQREAEAEMVTSFLQSNPKYTALKILTVDGRHLLNRFGLEDGDYLGGFAKTDPEKLRKLANYARQHKSK